MIKIISERQTKPLYLSRRNKALYLNLYNHRNNTTRFNLVVKIKAEYPNHDNQLIQTIQLLVLPV